MKQHFPEKKNAPPETFTDGQAKQCPGCGSLLGRYYEKVGKTSIRLDFRGFYCVSCGMIAFNRQTLNLAIEAIVHDETN